jgi:hypothetical protein
MGGWHQPESVAGFNRNRWLASPGIRNRYQQAVAAHQAGLVLIAHLRDSNRLLGSRLARLPERRRPFYTPVERFQILSLKEQMGLTNEESAQLFRLSPGTISRWMSHADPESETVGSLVKPIPPIRRYDDATQHLVQSIAGIGLGGYRKLVQWLGLVAIRISRSAVRRYLKGPRLPKPVPPVRPRRPVIARFVHHVTHIDSTWLKDFLGATAEGVTVMFDSFSRFPVGVSGFVGSPEPDAMIRFVEDTFRRLGTPRYLIADRGGEFTADRRTRRRLGRRPSFLLRRAPSRQRETGAILALSQVPPLRASASSIPIRRPRSRR